MYSKEPCCAEVLARLCLKEFHGRLVGFFNVQVVGEMGDESGEDPEFLVCGCLLLCIFERVERKQKSRGHIFFGDRKAPFRFVRASVFIDWQEVGVGALNCTVLRKFRAIDLANLREGG